MSSSRKLAIYSAVNIDATKQVTLPPRTDDTWAFDNRIPTQMQTGNRVYEGTGLDKGHLTRRLDPVWGDTAQEAQRADLDTFHYTNCAPQAAVFNRGRQLWAGLEDYILGNADLYDLKVSVINGPVFAATDPRVEDVAVPLSYWKVVAIRRANGNLSATAYLLTQQLPQPQPLAEAAADPNAGFSFGPYRTYQTAVADIQHLTALDFGHAVASDPYAARTPQATSGDLGPELGPARQPTQLTELTQVVL
jgi:endonuclease G